jgi:hypothetical protein
MSSDAPTTVPVSPDADSDAARRAARDNVVGDQQEVDAGFLYAWHFLEAASDYADRAKHFMDRLQVLASLGSAALTPTGLVFVDDWQRRGHARSARRVDGQDLDGQQRRMPGVDVDAHREVLAEAGAAGTTKRLARHDRLWPAVYPHLAWAVILALIGQASGQAPPRRVDPSARWRRRAPAG